MEPAEWKLYTTGICPGWLPVLQICLNLSSQTFSLQFLTLAKLKIVLTDAKWTLWWACFVIYCFQDKELNTNLFLSQIKAI